MKEPVYKIFLRKILFLFDAECVHRLIVYLLKIPFIRILLKWLYGFDHPHLARQLFGLTFKNPVGLAAGFDKNAEVISSLEALGFGFIEIGTVTPEPQAGNPRPRIFRLVEDDAIINRMGFNNDGVEAVCRRLRKTKRQVIIAGNIGKNRLTPNEQAIADYEKCFQALYDLVDFFVVNVSSPNTPHLRELQDKEPLRNLLSHLKKLATQQSPVKPILLKIAPDLNDSQLDDIITIVKQTGIDGIVATNTTVSREGLKTTQSKVEQIGEGGLSGKPLASRSTEIIRYLHQKSGGTIPIIGVGGIHSPRDALEKLEAGASLIELYTGFIYEGPALIKRIKKTLLKRRANE